jgi:uncharacterized protein
LLRHGTPDRIQPSGDWRMAQTAKTPESKTPESKLEARIREPSMEEILASIRRIIADEDAYASTRGSTKAEKAEDKFEARHEAKSVTPAPPAGDICETSHSTPAATARWREYESLSVSEEPNDGAAQSSGLESSAPEPLSETDSEPTPPIASRSHVADHESEEEFAQQSDRMPTPSFAGAAQGGRDPLLSQETTAAVDSAFNALAQTVLVQNARTLEDLVREMLRPLLKSWLDDNLPSLVERLVRAEIERVSRGRSG